MSDSLQQLRNAASAARRRNRLIVAARRDGYTWRVIADAAGMTELGTRQAASKANGGVLPQPGHTT